MSDWRIGEESPTEVAGAEGVPRYKIGTVASMVGVSSNVLRAWERRYSLPHPTRQSGKQRLYTERDVRLLRQVVEMMRNGLSISEVVALGTESLLGSPSTRAVAAAAPEPSLSLSPATRDRVDAWTARPVSAPPRHRYAGESFEVSVRSLSLSDAGTLHRLYGVVKGLYEMWTYMDQRSVAKILERRLSPLRESQFRAQLAQLGAATAARDPLLQEALHDAREGALSLLLERLKASGDLVGGQHLNLLVSLGRDHAKMLRNAFRDLDPALREADEHLKAHHLAPILSKLAPLRQGGWVSEVGTDFQGFISSRCLETSTLDRMLYRYLALLRRERTMGPNLWVLQAENGWVRWVFESEPKGAEPPTPGSFVADAVGLAAGLTGQQAVELGYLGSARGADRDWLWFHWPSYAPPPEVARCGCHPLT